MKLLESLESVVDPRFPKGVRHPVSAILKATTLGLLAGFTCIEHIAKYIAEKWDEISDELGFTHHHAPDADTYRRVLNQLNTNILSQAFEGWMSEFLEEKTFDVAVDGKACRGIKTGDDSRGTLMLLNVFAHDIQVVLSQWPLGKKQGEPTVLKEHLKDMVEKYPGIRLLTGDACFSGRNLCQAITDLHKDYLVRIKGNQPDIEEALSFWFSEQLKKQTPPDAQETEKKRAFVLPESSGSVTRMSSLTFVTN